MNPKFGPRYMKYSDVQNKYFPGEMDFGEWSFETNKLHGRGIQIRAGKIFIGYFNNGREAATGKYISIFSKDFELQVGEKTIGDDGKLHCMEK